jgi:hypothetical protein
MRQCSAIKANGERCKGIPIHASEWCAAHHPEFAEARRINGKKGGKRGGRGRPLAELKALRAENGQLREKMLKGELEPHKLAVAVQSINVDIRCLDVEMKAKEQEELEQRIEALENASTHQRTAG